MHVINENPKSPYTTASAHAQVTQKLNFNSNSHKTWASKNSFCVIFFTFLKVEFARLL